MPARVSELLKQRKQSGEQPGLLGADEPAQGADAPKLAQLSQSPATGIVHQETSVPVARRQGQRRRFTGINLETKSRLKFRIG